MPVRDFLKQAATISLLEVEQTSLGGAGRSPSVVASGVPCMVQPPSRLAYMVGRRDDARAEVIDATIWFDGHPIPGGLTTRHQIAVGPDAYNVVAVRDPNSLAHHLEVDCERIR